MSTEPASPPSPDQPTEDTPLDRLRDAFADSSQGTPEPDDQENDDTARESMQDFLSRTYFAKNFPVFTQLDRITSQFQIDSVIPDILGVANLGHVASSALSSSLRDVAPNMLGITASLNFLYQKQGTYTSLFHTGAFQALEEIQRSLVPAIDQIIPNWLSSFSIPNYAQLLLGALENRVIPDNLSELGLTVDDLDDIAEVLDDGIPLYLVPRARIASRLISAKTIQQRHRIIRDETPVIIDDCLDALDLVSNSQYLYKADRLREASELIVTHPAASQALSMAVLDSLMFQIRVRSGDIRGVLIEEKNRTKDGHAKIARKTLQDFIGRRGLLALAPVRPLYKRSREEDPPSTIPRSPNRNATLHRVHPYQYSKRNATITLMISSSVLVYMSRWFDTELKQAERRKRKGS